MSERPSTVNTDTLFRGFENMPKALDRMGFPGLRKGQDVPIAQIMGCRDTICVLPTGSGKTGVFVLPTLALGWKTLVFSPLIALMRDQVQSLQRVGIRAAQMSSGQTDAENILAARLWQAGELDLFYVAPERVRNEIFAQAVAAQPPDFVVADEGHVCSSWSDNFRPSYALVGGFIRQYNPKVVAAFTATMPPEVEADIRRCFCLEDAERTVYYPRRNNLKLSGGQLTGIHDVVKDLQAIQGPCIVYGTTTDKGVEQRALILSDMLGEEVGIYHGKMKESAKRMNMDNFMESRTRIMCATSAFGMGIDKAQPLTSRVLTPSGWRRMGDIQVGDTVIAGNGRATKVLFVNDRGVLPSYEVTFSDNTCAESALDHKWDTRSPKEKYRGKGFTTRSLEQIQRKLSDSYGNHQHFIPLVAPVEFEENNADLPLHPYLLGAILGDGGLTGDGVKFTNSDPWMQETVRKCLNPPLKLVPYNSKDFGIVYSKGKTNPAKSALRNLGIGRSGAASKFIPDVYLFSSIGNRIQVLQGLLDTDGSVTSCLSGVMYVTISDKLKDGVVQLVQSLGGTATYEFKGGGWYVYISMPKDILPFTRPCKANKFRPKSKYQPYRAITAVRYVGDKAMRCITVEDPSGLYVTDSFIVTHNSDVRGVICADMPRSCEDAAQQVGRAGRDEKTSFCKVYWDKNSRKTQEWFIDMGHPDRTSIESVYRAIVNMADGQNTLHASGEELSDASGVPGKFISACKSALIGSKVIEPIKMSAEEKTCMVVYKGSSEDPIFREWRQHIEYSGTDTGSGYIEIEQGLMESKLDTKLATIKKKFKEWDERGIATLIPPTRSAPVRIIGDISLVDFDRLRQKRQDSVEKLDKVQEFIECPDKDKHAFLENMFGVTAPQE